MQKQLLMVRMKLLKYMDCLYVYEQILGGSSRAAELFDAAEYKTMRSLAILQVALNYAHAADQHAVQVIFTYFHSELRHKQLDVLANFPETLDPTHYMRLLPRIRCDDATTDQGVVIFDDEDELRDQRDWIEAPQFADL